MITPRFWISQEENTVTIFVRAPYCALKDLDVDVDGEIFVFTCSPYFLRLKFPGRLQMDKKFNISFDSDKGEFTVSLSKAIPGEHFDNLDLITKLLQEKVIVPGEPKIEIMSSSGDTDCVNVNSDSVKYGFAMRGDRNFKAIKSEFKDVFEVDPFEVGPEERKILRVRVENEQFSPEHYLADFIENDEIEEIKKIQPPWLSTNEINFSPKELDFLKDLNNKQFNLSSEEHLICQNGLIDILFAYCYDRKTTYYDGTCESGWTICKLSATLCWFEQFLSLKEVITCVFRRSLIYPLYRDFNLSENVLSDLKYLIKAGPKQIVKSLINIYDIFLGGSCHRYILNNLYVKDYIIYVNQQDQVYWDDLLRELESVSVKKADLGLKLESIEESFLVEEGIRESLGKLTLESKSGEKTDSDDEEDSSNSSDTDHSLTTSSESTH